MVTYLPGPEALLAPAAQQLAQGLTQLIAPNLEAQRTLQMSIARNPAMLQQLADAEAMAPGTMERLGFGKIGQAAAAMPASAAQEYLIRNRQNVIRGYEAAQGAETAKNLLTGQNIQTVTDYMRDHPEANFETAFKMTTGRSLSEMTTDQFGARVAKEGMKAIEENPDVAAAAGTFAATHMTPAQLAEQRNQVAAQQRAGQMSREGASITLDKFLNGQYNMADLDAIMSTPAGKGVALMIEAYSAQQRALAANGDNNAMERMKQTKAFDLFAKLHGGTVDAAYRFLWDPVAGRRAYELLADPTKVRDQGDRDLLTVAQQVQSLDDAERRTQLTALGKDLMSFRAGFNQTLRPRDQGGIPGSAGDAQRTLLVQQMNDVLKQRTLFGAPAYTVEFAEVPIWGGLWHQKQLVYKDAEGNVVPEGLVDQPVAIRKGPPPPPAGTDTTQTPPAAGGGAAATGAAATQAPAAGTAAGSAAPAVKPSPNNSPANIPPQTSQGPITPVPTAMVPGPPVAAAPGSPQGAGPLATPPMVPAPTGLEGTPAFSAQGAAQVASSVPGVIPGANATTATGQPVFVRRAMIGLKKQTLAEMRAQFARWKAELTPEQYTAIRDAADAEYPNSKTIKR